MRHTSLLLLGTLLPAASLFAQSETPWSVGVSAGAFVYQGDLAPSALGSYKTLKPAFAVWGSRTITSRLSLRANLAFGSLHGDDARFSSPSWRPERALRFDASVFEVSALAVWDVGPGIGRMQPYLFAGIGYSFVNVNRDASRFNATYFAADKTTEGLATDLSRTPPRSLPVVPLGGGVRYALTDRLTLHAETNYRLSRTDYLDGFSEAGNPKLYDHYQSWSVGVSWNFASRGIGGGRGKTGCPSVQ